MTRMDLYRYEREPGKWTISPIEPPEGTEYTLMYRLIADEGKVLTKDGESFVGCIDTTVEDSELWYEVDDPEPPMVD